MIRPLRKYHFIIWRAWALLLPLVFILAILVRPPLPNPLPNVKDTFVAELTGLTDSTSLVQIKIAKPLAVPSCLVYYTTHNQDILLGKMDRQGIYNFIIAGMKENVTLKLYDGIHKKTISSFTLNRNRTKP